MQRILVLMSAGLMLALGACGDDSSGSNDPVCDPTCDANATCANTDGSYTCTCDTGYQGDGMSCYDVDECTTAGHNCDTNATCTNTPGSFTCACDAGYTGDGTTCADVNECTAAGTNCDTNATCTNTPGSFDCDCNAGYAGTGDVCYDIDECLSGLDNCDAHATCTNELGSFSCACPLVSVDTSGDGTACTYFETCWDIKLNVGAGLPDGQYVIDPDGMGTGLDPFTVYCDMTTDAGGWTIVYSATGADGEEPMVSDTAVAGDAFTAHFNLNRAQKMAVAALSSSSIFVRSSGEWIAADHELFDGTLDTASSEAHYPVALRSSDGVQATGQMGWSNYNIAGGGDFHVSTGTVDHHSADYWNLNSGCVNQYLYSYSGGAQDGDVGYDVNTALGNWLVTTGCQAAEGGLLAFYAAMRPGLSELDIGPQLNTHGSSSVFGYYFTAPVTFTITGMRVPEDASTGAQAIHFFRFNSGVPTAQTSDFTTLAYVNSLAGSDWYPVSITINAGETVGVLGWRGTESSFGDRNYDTTIAGQPTTLYRLYSQNSITTAPAIDVGPDVGDPIGRVEIQYYTP